jgi:glycosyltransferase involved in cell wall biosynthesis
MAETPARIAFVLPSFAAGGAQRVMVLLAAGLDRSRFTPFFVVWDDSGAWRSMVPAGVRVVVLGRRRLLTALPGLLVALRREQPHTVVSTLAYVNMVLLLAKSLIGRHVRLVVREANTARRHSKGLLGRLGYAFGYRVLYRRADRIVCPAAYLVEELAADHGVKRDKVTVLANPVEEDALRKAAMPPRRRPGTGHRFVAVGRLSEQKGYDRLLRDFARLPADSHLTVFGEGPERESLERLIDELGLAGRVALAGFDPVPGAWVAGADALLLPSRWEGMPNVALEALACGTPVIATPEAGGIVEIASQAAPGAVVLAATGGEFAEAMRSVPQRTEVSLRESLLPTRYKIERVTEDFAAILAA